MASWYGYTGPESPEEYLEQNVFPTLMQGLEEMLQVAKKTERRKRFNPLDYLVAYLYRHNPQHVDRDRVALADIPFVKEEWAINPRAPLPLSATLTEEEAAIIIQKHYRGYVGRKDKRAALFREWQRRLHQEREEAAKKITFFLKKVSTTTNKYKEEIERTKEGEAETEVAIAISTEHVRPKIAAGREMLAGSNGQRRETSENVGRGNGRVLAERRGSEDRRLGAQEERRKVVVIGKEEGGGEPQQQPRQMSPQSANMLGVNYPYRNREGTADSYSSM